MYNSILVTQDLIFLVYSFWVLDKYLFHLQHGMIIIGHGNHNKVYFFQNLMNKQVLWGRILLFLVRTYVCGPFNFPISRHTILMTMKSDHIILSYYMFFNHQYLFLTQVQKVAIYYDEGKVRT